MADALSASRILQLPAAPPPPLPLHRSLRRFPLPARSELPKSFPAPASSSIPPPHRSWTAAAAATSWNSVEEGAKVPDDNDAPSSIQLLPLASEEEFDRIIADEPVVVLWIWNVFNSIISQKSVSPQQPSMRTTFWSLPKGLLNISTKASWYNDEWMAKWCRKCIYLKPKLEKLAADYHPRIRFYCVDVNAVPQRLVSRAGITKMPTIQLWKDSQKLGEVIGGHKAWLVVEDVRRMIEN